jgi:hypothetical protein
VNLLELTPALKRHLKQWVKVQDTDSILAAYLADGIEALAWRWERTYVISVTQPNTYTVLPDIAVRDKRPIILMASIIYKTGNVELAGFRDGDFAYDPQQGRANPILTDVAELDKMLPLKPNLAHAISSPMRGFANALNPESYARLVDMGVLGAIY